MYVCRSIPFVIKSDDQGGYTKQLELKRTPTYEMQNSGRLTTMLVSKVVATIEVRKENCASVQSVGTTHIESVRRA